MSPPPRKRQDARLTAITTALALIAMLLIIQMWLLTATLEAYLAGHHDAALPGAIASGVLLVASIALYVLLERTSAQ